MADNERIDELLAHAADPVMREIVIVLGNINRELQTNTKATSALVSRIESINQSVMDGNAGAAQSTAALNTKISKHMVDEEIMLAGFRGKAQFASWIAPILFTILGGVGLYIWTTQALIVNETSALLRTVQQRQLVNEQIIAELLRRQAHDESVQNR